MTTVSSNHNDNSNAVMTVVAAAAVAAVAVVAMTKSAERNECHYMAYTLFIYVDDTA